MTHSWQVRWLGICPYVEVWQNMQTFTAGRDATTPDELWLVEHEPVFTLGQAGRSEHVLNPGAIPVVRSDRGGQVTYHGPGQLVIYVLFDLRRADVGVRQLVSLLEIAAIDCLADHGIQAHTRAGAPGVYVDDAKIAALGLRVRRGCSYHGLSLNVAMDLEPFARIHPCGYAGLRITQMRDLGCESSLHWVGETLVGKLRNRLGVCATEKVPAGRSR